jgi:hypothetical protein
MSSQSTSNPQQVSVPTKIHLAPGILLSKKLATVCIAVPIGFKPDKLFVISDTAQVNNSVNTCRNVLNLLLNSRENFQRLNTLYNSETTNVDLRDALCRLEKKKKQSTNKRSCKRMLGGPFLRSLQFPFQRKRQKRSQAPGMNFFPLAPSPQQDRECNREANWRHTSTTNCRWQHL